MDSKEKSLAAKKKFVIHPDNHPIEAETPRPRTYEAMPVRSDFVEFRQTPGSDQSFMSYPFPSGDGVVSLSHAEKTGGKGGSAIRFRTAVPRQGDARGGCKEHRRTRGHARAGGSKVMVARVSLFQGRDNFGYSKAGLSIVNFPLPGGDNFRLSIPIKGYPFDFQSQGPFLFHIFTFNTKNFKPSFSIQRILLFPYTFLANPSNSIHQNFSINIYNDEKGIV